MSKLHFGGRVAVLNVSFFFRNGGSIRVTLSTARVDYYYFAISDVTPC
jgi:hypothetical protein